MEAIYAPHRLEEGIAALAGESVFRAIIGLALIGLAARSAPQHPVRR